MAVYMAWDDASQTIMRCTSDGKWTWEEYHQTLTQIVELFKKADHRVDLIITREHGSTMPASSPLPHFQRAMQIMPPNVGLVALVNTNAFARTLVSMFSSVFARKTNAKLILVGSLEEARSRIAAHRAGRASTRL